MLPDPLPDSYTLLTAIGAAKLANAFATSTPLVITEFAVGDAGGSAYTPPVDSNDYVTQTDLVNEIYRDNILQKAVDPADPTLVKIRCQIPSDEGGYTIREVGLFDDDGDMIAIMINEQYKPAAGSGSTISVMNLTFLLHVANTATVTLGYTVAEYTDFSASTNTPPIASLTPGNSFLVITAGRLSGVSITGAIAGADSVVLAGDIIKNINGQLQLASRDINTVTSIPCGTGGLFTTLGAANTYINQRRLTAVVSLNFAGTATTTETASLNINHVDGANLQILGTSGGTTFDFSSTVGNNITISCNCILTDISIKSNSSTQVLSIVNNPQFLGTLTLNNIGSGNGLASNQGSIFSVGVTITLADSNKYAITLGHGSDYRLSSINTNANLGISGSLFCNGNVTCNGIADQFGTISINGSLSMTIGFFSCINAKIICNGAVTCAGFTAGENGEVCFNSTLSCTSYSPGINSRIYHRSNVTNSGTFTVNPGASIYFLGTMSYTGAYTLQGGSTVYHADNLIPTAGTFFAATSARAYYDGTKPTGYAGNSNSWLGNN